MLIRRFLCTLLPLFLGTIVVIVNAFDSLHHSPDIASRLQRLLSPTAKVYLPGSQDFNNATTRWNKAINPRYLAIVAVTSEQDIIATIKFANAFGLPFLTIGGDHGSSLALNELENGVGISTRGMAKVQVSPTGDSATIFAGSHTGEITKALWAQGKTTALTACDCVGIFGPALGGGHGYLQGDHGLVIDNVLSYRLVLANGTAVTVSQAQHPELFWALRGAGHNFGVVVSMEYKIYDRSPATDVWSVQQYVFSGDQVSAVYEQANLLLRRPGFEPLVDLSNFGLLVWVPQGNTTQPVLLFNVLWHGDAVPSKYTDPFNALKPISVTSNTTDTITLNTMMGSGEDSAVCVNSNWIQAPTDLDSYNATAMQEVFDVWASLPDWLHSSVMLIEGYSIAAVQAVPDASTAYPLRAQQLLLSPVVSYASGTGSYDEAKGYADQIRHVLVEGSGRPLHAYVNYAYGDESLEAVYGYEPWRLEKLRRLKRQWDPENKFGFFEPIRGA